MRCNTGPRFFIASTMCVIALFFALHPVCDHNHTTPLRPNTPIPKDFIQVESGLLLYTSRWEVTPASEERGVVFLCHGYGEHGRRFARTATELQSAGFSVYALDHQGHGRSEGDRAFIPQWESLIDDVHTYVQHVLRERVENGRREGVPLFMMGQSMGGMIALHSTHRHPEMFAATYLSGPLIHAHPDVAKPWLIPIAKVLGRLMPKLQLPGEKIDAFAVSTPERAQSYMRDPHTYKGYHRCGTGAQLFASCEEGQRIAPEVTWPIMIGHAENDTACDPIGNKQWFDELPSKDKRFQSYGGKALHDLLDDPANTHVRADLIKWFEQHLPENIASK